MLNEVSGAAEIMEAHVQGSLSVPVKDRLINLIVILAAVVLMSFFIKTVISETLSKIH
ncbi:MAG: hypothetical protein Q7R35_10615 [Elusimicrobiota bacterium]|nr:hypothetical protein [Elusimicrobiota bacterium]